MEVEDEGPGLPEGEERRAFETFTRYHQGRAPGAGLGLAIVRGIVEAHGGTVEAANRPEGGAVFRFCLPLGPALLE
ncbi:Sensor protein KdpD [compost metagenome]